MDIVQAVEQDNLRNSYPEVDVGDFCEIVFENQGRRKKAHSGFRGLCYRT